MPELSHNDIRQLLEQVLNEGQPTATPHMRWIRDVFPSYFVYQDEGVKLYRRTYVIGSDKAVTLGAAEEVTEVRSYEPVVTTAAYSLVGAATFSEGGEVVLRKGKLFEAGEYPDKSFSLSEAELADAVANFTPVNVDLDHFPHMGIQTVLDNKLGQLQAVEVGADGKTLFGTVALPKWLDNVLTDAERKVSCTWDRATKRLAGLALTLTPRVTDAALMSAYAQFAGSRHSEADRRDLQAIHDLVVGQGAECKAAMSATKKEKKMGLWDDIVAAFKKNNVEVPAELQEGAPEQPVQPPVAPQADPLVIAQFSSMQAEIDRLNNERRLATAKSEVARLKYAGKLLPYEEVSAVALFAEMLALDETTNQQVTFTNAKGEQVQDSRFNMVKAPYEARQSHGLFREELVSGTALFALSSGGEQTKTAHEQGLEQGKTFVENNYAQNGASGR